MPNKEPGQDATVADGAGVAVRTCMAVQPDDRVLVIGDLDTLDIGTALVRAAEEVGATTQLLRLEDYCARPILEAPPALFEAVEYFQPTVSFFAAASVEGEIGFRLQLGKRLRDSPLLRHGHMPGITSLLMQDGMNTDYRLVHDVTLAVNAIVREAATVCVTNPGGTDLTVNLLPEFAWVPCHGLYHHPGEWGNLPEGETFTCPASVDGIIVAEILGDYFSEKYGLLDDPVSFHIERGYVADISGGDAALVSEVEAYLDSSENGRRVGEFAIGTNVGLTKLVGNLLQDEKYPGIHLAFGNPYPRRTGADWNSNIHVDVIPTECTIVVDGRRLMTDGVFEDWVLSQATP